MRWRGLFRVVTHIGSFVRLCLCKKAERDSKANREIIHLICWEWPFNFQQASMLGAFKVWRAIYPGWSYQDHRVCKFLGGLVIQTNKQLGLGEMEGPLQIVLQESFSGNFMRARGADLWSSKMGAPWKNLLNSNCPLRQIITHFGVLPRGVLRTKYSFLV